MRLPLAELLLSCVLLAAYATVPLGVDSAIIWGCLLLQYGLLVAAVQRPVIIYRGLPTYLTAEFLFLFFSYLVFFYPYQLHVLGIFDVSKSAFFQDTYVNESNHAILLCSIGTVSFRAGIRALRAPALSPDEAHRHRQTNRLDQVKTNALALPIIGLQLLLIATYSVLGWTAAGEGRYSGQIAGGPVVEGVYLAIIVLSMASVALWVLPASEEDPRSEFILLSGILSSLWAVRLLMNGDRNSFMLIAIVAIGGFVTFRFRGGRWVLAILCATAIGLYNAIEAFRSGKIGSLVDFFLGGWGVTASSYGGDTSFNISTVGVRAALASVPEHIDYGFGLYKLIGIGGIIPFIRGLVIPPDIPYTQSSDVLNDILLGEWASWGVGSNVIVDIYVDFGVLAVPILLFTLGLFVAFVQRAVAQLPDSPWRGVCYLMTLALTAEIPRYSLDFPLRPLVWTLLLFWVVSLIPIGSSPRARRLNGRRWRVDSAIGDGRRGDSSPRLGG
jgi:oligosaccharide repeat unit polymerase